MAVLFITEFANTTAVEGGDAQVAKWPALAHQTVAIGVTSAQSNPFHEDTRLIRVGTDAVCSIDIGTDPTATATECRMAADTVEYHGVTGGHKLAVITNN